MKETESKTGMTTTSKICSVCFRPNNSSLAECRRCDNPLTESASEEQVRDYYRKKGLPAGVILFTALASVGFFVSFPQMIGVVPVSEFSPFDWLQIVAMNVALLVLTAGLLLSREWARKGIIYFQLAAVFIGIGSLFAMQGEKGAGYEHAFRQYEAREQGEVQSGRRQPLSNAELRIEFRGAMDLSNTGVWVPMVLMMLVTPAVWFAYFSGPVKRYFHYKELIRAENRRAGP